MEVNYLNSLCENNPLIPSPSLASKLMFQASNRSTLYEPHNVKNSSSSLWSKQTISGSSRSKCSSFYPIQPYPFGLIVQEKLFQHLVLVVSFKYGPQNRLANTRCLGYHLVNTPLFPMLSLMLDCQILMPRFPRKGMRRVIVNPLENVMIFAKASKHRSLEIKALLKADI